MVNVEGQVSPDQAEDFALPARKGRGWLLVGTEGPLLQVLRGNLEMYAFPRPSSDVSIPGSGSNFCHLGSHLGLADLPDWELGV